MLDTSCSLLTSFPYVEKYINYNGDSPSMDNSYPATRQYRVRSEVPGVCNRPMISQQSRKEMEEALGQVPSWMEELADQTGDHSWGIFRDLELGENTDLSPREKSLVGVGVASAISCPYCTYFHKEEARLSDVTDDELREAVNLASSTRYFSTILHGNEVDLDDFTAECDQIATHIKEQHAAAADD